MDLKFIIEKTLEMLEENQDLEFKTTKERVASFLTRTITRNKEFRTGFDEIENKFLLKELGQRIKAGKIKGNSFEYGCCHGFTRLYTGKTQGTYAFWKPEFSVDLHDGEITENKIDDKPDTRYQDEHETATK